MMASAAMATAVRLALGGLTLAVCLAFAFEATEGFRVLTSARRPALMALRHPAFEVPMTAVSQGVTSTSLPSAGMLRVVEITYERCRTLCGVQGASLAEVFRALHSEVAAGHLRFVSLSVDPGDCPTGMAHRVRRLSADQPGWDGVCVKDEAALEKLTRRIGVVAIQDEWRDYRHTQGVFLVGGDGHVLAYEPSLNKQTLTLAIQQALQTPDGVLAGG